MRNIKLTIEYDGSRYQGWSRLGKNESNNTISNKLQEVLRKKMTGEFLIELSCGCGPRPGSTLTPRSSILRRRVTWRPRRSNIT